MERGRKHIEMALIAAHVLLGNYVSAAAKSLKNWKWIVGGIGTAIFTIVLLASLLVSLPGIVMQSMLQTEKEDSYKELSIFAQQEVTEAEEEKKGFLQELLDSLKGDDGEESKSPTIIGDIDNQQVMILYAVKYGEYTSKSKLSKKQIRELSKSFIEIDGFTINIKPFEQVVSEIGLTPEQETIALSMYEHYIGATISSPDGGLNDEPFVGTGNGTLSLPVYGYRLTSKFGTRVHPVTGKVSTHTGVDLAVPMGTPIKAACEGKVVTAKYAGSYGNLVILDHGVINGKHITTYYAHNSALPVRVGSIVKKGQVIALSGSTGRSTGPHVHFEVRVDGKPQNPFAWV